MPATNANGGNSISVVEYGLTEPEMFQFWVYGFGAGMSIVVAVWLVVGFRAASSWESDY